MKPITQPVVKNGILIDSLFHGLFSDPPFECNENTDIVTLLLQGGVTAISTTITDDNYPASLLPRNP